MLKKAQEQASGDAANGTRRTSRGSVSRRAPYVSTSKSELVREEIFNRAIVLFEKKGFRGTSMQDIAESCELSKPAIYYYFKSKSDFLKEIHGFMTKKFFDDMEDIAKSDKTQKEKIEEIVTAQIHYSITHRKFLRILQQDRRELRPPERAVLIQQERRYEDMVEQLLREGQRKGEFRKDDPRLVTMYILGLLSSVHRWGHAVERENKAFAKTLTDLILRSISRSSA